MLYITALGELIEEDFYGCKRYVDGVRTSIVGDEILVFTSYFTESSQT